MHVSWEFERLYFCICWCTSLCYCKGWLNWHNCWGQQIFFLICTNIIMSWSYKCFLLSIIMGFFLWALLGSSLFMRNCNIINSIMFHAWISFSLYIFRFLQISNLKTIKLQTFSIYQFYNLFYHSCFLCDRT